MVTQRAVLLVGHGTIASASDVPEFLRRIRRGRPPSEALVSEIRRRYDYIGGSPLLRVTESLGRAVEDRLGLPVRVAMRFWDPLILDVVRALAKEGVKELLVLPVAPFSVHVYAEAVREAAATLGEGAPGVHEVRAYGSHPLLVAAHAGAIAPLLARHGDPGAELVLTAHSLPARVIADGDPYQREFEASARALLAKLGREGTLAYQSQGADGGDWLGPTLADAFVRLKAAGKRSVIVAPVGFLADHVETLYDLDVEAAEQARGLGLAFHRVPALGDSAPLADALAAVLLESLP